MTRLSTLAADVFGALTTFSALATTVLFLIGTFAGSEPTISSGSWVGLIGAAIWFLAWFAVPVALFGRTPAMAIAGLGVLQRDGRVANARRATVRALFLPLSIAVLGLGLVGIVVGRERRSLHDVAAGTVVVYDWGTRQAEQPNTVRELLSARVAKRRRAADRSAEPPKHNI